MKIIFSIAVKDLKLIFRDKSGVFFIFLFPVIYAVLFGGFFGGFSGGAKKTVLVVVDNDKSDRSAEFIKNLRKNPSLEILEKNLITARNNVGNGKIPVLLKIEKNFGANLPESIFKSRPGISMEYDPSKIYVSQMLQGLLLKEFYNFWLLGLPEHISVIRKRFTKTFGSTPLVSDTVNQWFDQTQQILPLFRKHNSPGLMFSIPSSVISKPDQSSPGPFDISFPQGIIWGIIGATAVFAVSFVNEKNNGTLARIRAAPVSLWQIISGKLLGSMITILMVIFVMTFISTFIFSTVITQVVWFAVYAILMSFSFSGMMLFVSSFAKTEQSASGLTWSVFMLLAMLGGGMIPVHFMPEWMSEVTLYSPVGWAIKILEASAWRNSTFTEVLPQTFFLLITGILCFIVGSAVLKKSLEK
ncbi:MAG: ABC transporter permease [Deltaproteobacteria bacterium]|nr:ABC transporter permease [Deltaproteobacteria bacterium]